MTFVQRLLLGALALLWVMQLGLDFFSNFVGGGLTILGDIVLGGMQIYIAYRIACAGGAGTRRA